MLLICMEHRQHYDDTQLKNTAQAEWGMNGEETIALHILFELVQARMPKCISVA